MFRIEGGKKLFDPEFVKLIKDQKNAEEAYSIIKNHPSDNFFDSDGTHLIHLAVKCDSHALLYLLYRSGWDIDVEDSSGTTPWVTAVLSGHFHIAYHLFSEKKDRIMRQQRESDSNISFRDRERMVDMQLMENYIPRLRKKGFSSERIGDSLRESLCWLTEVVRFQDPLMTKGYVQTQYGCIPATKDTFEIVIPTFNIQHIQVLTQIHTCAEFSMYRFCRCLLNDIGTYKKSKGGRDFLKRAFSWEIFHDETTFDCLERALMKTTANSLRMFLQCGFHSEIKAKYDRDVLLGLFGNPNIKITSFIQIDKIDFDHHRFTDRRYKDYTLLHLAAKANAARNIQLLLDRGADPNSYNGWDFTPLDDAFAYDRDEKCLRLLLLGGANPLLSIRDEYENQFFGFRASTLESSDENELDTAKRVIKLLAAHLAIYGESGRSIERHLKAYKNLNSQELDDFYEECQRQLKMLKSCKIHSNRREMTMFTILAERPEKICCYVTDEDLTAIFTFVKCNRKTLNPYYREALKKYARDIADINYRRNRAIEIICEIIGIHDSHHLVIDKIVNYLSIKDLFFFK